MTSTEVINITKLNAELEITVVKIDQARKGVDNIITELEGRGA